MTAERPPLAAYNERFAEASAKSNGTLTIAENPLWQQVNLRIAPDDSDALTIVLGSALPTVPNTITNIPGGFVVWLGPDEWLVVEPEGTPDLEARLRGALGAGGPDDPAGVDNPGRAVAMSVVDVSSVRTVISLSGTAVRTVMAHGCGLDLDASVFPPGRCAQTKLALANVVLIAPHEQSAEFDVLAHFLVMVRASFAPYLADWLLDAAAEFLTE